MRLKPSMFNFTYQCGDGSLRLYNSFQGTKSLTIVDNNSRKSVVNLLQSDEIINNSYESMKLFEYGYLIPSDVDEKAQRNIRIMERIMDNTLHLIILPTEQCNFRCKYCYETFSKGAMSKDVQNNIINYVRKNIHRFTSVNVSWFGGEPLEELHVIEYISTNLIKICNTARKNYTAGITTNGYNLSLDTFNTLYNNKILSYQITLDGLKDNHNKQRVLANNKGSYDVILKNLINIKNNVKNSALSFMIRTNFSKSMVSNINEYIDFYNEVFGEDKRFNFYIHKASNWGGERVNEFEDELMDDNDYKNLLIKFINKKSLNFNGHMSHLNTEGCVCYASKRNAFVIGSDGNIYKCTGNFMFPENNVGKLLDGGIMELNNNYYNWIQYPNENLDKCDNCYYSGCCLSICCPSVRIRKLEGSSCSLEKDHLSKFIQLWDKKYFNVIGDISK